MDGFGTFFAHSICVNKFKNSPIQEFLKLSISNFVKYDNFGSELVKSNVKNPERNLFRSRNLYNYFAKLRQFFQTRKPFENDFCQVG